MNEMYSYIIRYLIIKTKPILFDKLAVLLNNQQINTNYNNNKNT